MESKGVLCFCLGLAPSINTMLFFKRYFAGQFPSDFCTGQTQPDPRQCSFIYVSRKEVEGRNPANSWLTTTTKSLLVWLGLLALLFSSSPRFLFPLFIWRNFSKLIFSIFIIPKEISSLVSTGNKQTNKHCRTAPHKSNFSQSGYEDNKAIYKSHKLCELIMHPGDVDAYFPINVLLWIFIMSLKSMQKPDLFVKSVFISLVLMCICTHAW